jgi:hypothetical protein
MAEHTPVPWRVHTLYLSEIYATVDEKRMQIADISGACSQLDEANAAFVVKAVNAHDILVQALEFIRDGYDNYDVNHVDYRVKVYQVALDALGAVGTSRDCGK